MPLAVTVLAGVLGAELLANARRMYRRRDMFRQAAERAQALGRPLVIVGDPDGGAMTRLFRAYGCGDPSRDVCVDLVGCRRCPNGVAADLTAGPVPGVADDSAVVYVACVLEYVGDVPAAWREILRMAGSPGNVFVVEVEPWSLTAVAYPGARHTIRRPAGEPAPTATPVHPAAKWAALGGAAALGALAWHSLRRRGR
jgi:hypothetical protein